MSPSTDPAAPASEVETLLSLLERDPHNVNLLSDAAERALQTGQPGLARDMLTARAALTQSTPRLNNQLGLALLQLGEFDVADQIFAELLGQNPDETGLRFNRAWCRASLHDPEAALALLRDADVETLPQAAMLRVHALHDLGRLDEALSQAKRLIAIHPNHAPLLGAASTLAIDAEDLDFADQCARAAGDTPEALTSLATIALAHDEGAQAARLFTQALGLNPNAPRAVIGAGLTKMLAGDHAHAAAEIEHGATLFEDHIGSWVAAGWAYIFANDSVSARRCLEHALQLDRNFGETHGSLAVLNLIEGRTDEARHQAETAQRLNPQSFSAALARAMLASSKGQTLQARAILDRALHTPLDQSGRTLAQSLARHGLLCEVWQAHNACRLTLRLHNSELEKQIV